MIRIREAEAADLPAVTAIYDHHARTGTGTFEEAGPDLAEMTRRWEAVRAMALPYRVAIGADDQVLGFAYASPFRARPAYRYLVEDSVYIAPGSEAQGLGRALLEDLIRACEAAGSRGLLAVIGDRANAASIGLHTACGFVETGTLPYAGFKFGRWVDVVLMHRPLNGGDRTPPEGPGWVR